MYLPVKTMIISYAYVLEIVVKENYYKINHKYFNNYIF